MSQKQEILNILSDGLPHRSDYFQTKMFGSTKFGLFRLGARVFDLRKEGHNIAGWKDAQNPAFYWYQLKTGDLNALQASQKVEADPNPVQYQLGSNNRWTGFAKVI
jgi:hypothetical protein